MVTVVAVVSLEVVIEEEVDLVVEELQEAAIEVVVVEVPGEVVSLVSEVVLRLSLYVILNAGLLGWWSLNERQKSRTVETLLTHANISTGGT